MEKIRQKHLQSKDIRYSNTGAVLIFLFKALEKYVDKIETIVRIYTEEQRKHPG